jgi:hypothetical protein
MVYLWLMIVQSEILVSNQLALGSTTGQYSYGLIRIMIVGLVGVIMVLLFNEA